MKEFINSQRLAEVIADIAPFKCLDIGARGKPLEDLNSFAWAVDLYGFEPDRAECDKLNASYCRHESHPFGNIVFYPVALGQRAYNRPFYITKWGGTSSFMQPAAEIGEKFVRVELTEVIEMREIDTVPLDDFLMENNLHDIVYLKLDVEGLELEILESAKSLLQSTLLALVVEVFYLRVHKGRPLYGELETFLRSYGFMPMEILYQNYWRRFTRTKYPKKCNGLIPFSKGQLVHGDVLFYKDPDILKSNTKQEIELLLKGAIIAINYGHVDHAYYIMQRPSVKEYLENEFGLSIERELRKVSLNLASQYRKDRITRLLDPVRERIGNFANKHPSLRDKLDLIR